MYLGRGMQPADYNRGIWVKRVVKEKKKKALGMEGGLLSGGGFLARQVSRGSRDVVAI